MGMNKRGIAFIMMAVILVGIMIMTVTYRERVYYKQQADRAGVRIEILNEFIKNLDQDIERATSIIAFRGLLGLQQYIIQQGTYLTNVSDSFNEVVINGTVNGTTIDLMENSTILDWASNLESEVARMNIQLDLDIDSLKIYHTNPWTVQVWFNVSIDVDDDKGTASWTIQKSMTSDVSIIGMEDPTTAVNSMGRVTSQIYRSNFSYYVDQATNDTTNLLTFINSSFYTNNTGAPSLLQRMEGDFTPSPYGIERLLDLQKFLEQGAGVLERSAVDWVYYTSDNETLYNIDGVTTEPGYEWFRLDDDAAARYDADQLKYT